VAFQPLQQGLGAEQAHARGRQLDGQRQAIQAPADLGYCRGIFFRQLEAGPHGLGALNEQAHRLGSGQRFEGGLFEIGGGQAERRHGQELFRPQMQRLPAGDQHLQVGACLQQLCQLGGNSRDLFQVIQQQEHFLVFQLFFHLIYQRALAGFTNANGAGDGRQDSGRIADGGQIDKIHPIFEATNQLSRRLQR
jgi:hypothetical protein